MSKLSFRARALDASKPLPVFRCEDLPDLHEYASINRAVPQMPTGMEKEEESVRVNSPVRPTAGPRSLRCLRRRRRSADPHKMAAIFSPPPIPVAGGAFTSPPPASPPGRGGPAGPPVGPPADPGPSDPGPAEFRRPQGTKGSRDEAAGSHFVVGALGLGLVHPERERAGGRAGGGGCGGRAAEAPPAGLSACRWVALWGRLGLRAPPAPAAQVPGAWGPCSPGGGGGWRGRRGPRGAAKGPGGGGGSPAAEGRGSRAARIRLRWCVLFVGLVPPFFPSPTWSDSSS